MCSLCAYVSVQGHRAESAAANGHDGLRLRCWPKGEIREGHGGGERRPASFRTPLRKGNPESWPAPSWSLCAGRHGEALRVWEEWDHVPAGARDGTASGGTGGGREGGIGEGLGEGTSRSLGASDRGHPMPLSSYTHPLTPHAPPVSLPESSGEDIDPFSPARPVSSREDPLLTFTRTSVALHLDGQRSSDQTMSACRLGRYRSCFQCLFQLCRQASRHVPWLAAVPLMR